MESSLLKEVAKLPCLPGVYLMRDAGGEIIYIGKAKDLRSRVRSYFGAGDGRSQIEFLMRRVAQIEKIVTQSEDQAFILERDLINKHKPRYNIRLKDDKAYLSVRIDEDAEWPRLELVRKIANDGARYFGPYSFGYQLKSLLEIVKRVVPLRTCSDTVFYNRARPCIEYQIKRCAGPCVLPVDREEYRAWVKQAIALLEGKNEKLQQQLEEKMERAATDLRFEDAAVYRDRVEVLRSFRGGEGLVSTHAEDRDVFGLYREERLVVVSVLMQRLGRISNNLNFSFSDVQVSDQEILESVLGQFYQGDREIPSEIVLPFKYDNLSITASYLQHVKEHKVEFAVPRRGLKYRLLKLAELNARQHFIAKFDAEARYLEVAKSLALKLKLKQVPRRVECVDISNFQGSDIVGALVVFFDGQPQLSEYKRYNISQQGKPDDFGAVYEVVKRRLTHAKEDGQLSDLLIIDGGAGQLSAAIRARDELHVSMEIVALAKWRSEGSAVGSEPNVKPERVFLEGVSEPIEFDSAQHDTHFLQRIRDETHRFVIGFHRRKRSKRVFSSSLERIPGIGPERRQRLLKEFGSIERLKVARPEDIARAGRMPLPLATKLLRILN